MSPFTENIDVRTKSSFEIVNITSYVEEAVKRSKIIEGSLIVFTQHTTTAITINEDEPRLVNDILKKLSDVVPSRQGYSHDQIDSNAHAHILASIIGPSIAIPILKGKAALGTWQSIFFIEFDGPRNRKVTVQIL